MAVEVLDPRELVLPNVGTLTVVDPETGARRDIQTQSRKVRERYAQAAAEQRSDIAQALRESHVSHLQLATDRDWLLDVVRFVAARKAMAGKAR